MSLVMFATAARTEPIQTKVPTANRTSQTLVNSANEPSEALHISQTELQQDAQPLPDELDTSTVNTNTEALPTQGDLKNSEAATETLPATVSDTPATTTDTKTQESQMPTDPPNPLS